MLKFAKFHQQSVELYNTIPELASEYRSLYILYTESLS